LIGKADKLFGQIIEETEILDLPFDLLGVRRRNAFRALLTVKRALQDEVGSELDGLAIALGFEELATEGTPSQVVDLLHATENVLAFGTKNLDGISHVRLYLLRYSKTTPIHDPIGKNCFKVPFLSHTPTEITLIQH